MTQPFCFVLMPFGKKPNAAGAEIDFDAVYSTLIAPAIEAAGMEPIRADHEAERLSRLDTPTIAITDNLHLCLKPPWR